MNKESYMEIGIVNTINHKNDLEGELSKVIAKTFARFGLAVMIYGCEQAISRLSSTFVEKNVGERLGYVSTFKGIPIVKLPIVYDMNSMPMNKDILYVIPKTTY